MQVRRDEVLEAIRYQIHQLTTVEQQNDERKQIQWREDSEVLKAYVSALSATRSVLKDEQNAVLAKMHRLKTKAKNTKSKTTATSSFQNTPQNPLTKAEVQNQLAEFRQRIKEAENRVEQALLALSGEVKTEERSMLQDQVNIMRETQKLCLAEAQLLEVMLKEMETAEEKQKSEAADWEELGRLKNQLTKLEAKIDHAKRCLLFPSVHGFKLRVGSGGIYVGAKDLYVSDLSAGFSLSVESVNTAEKTAVIQMHMGGRERRPSPIVIAETDSSDDCVDLMSMTTEANEINNHPPSSPSVQAASVSVLEEDDRHSSHQPHHAEQESDSAHSQEQETVANLQAVLQPSPSLNLVETETDPLTQNPTVSESEPNELLAELYGPELQSSSMQALPEPSVPEEDNVAQAMKTSSPGKSFAMKFLTKIADRSHVPRGIAKASHALFFTPLPSPQKPRHHDRRPSFNQTLFKKFALSSDTTRQVEGDSMRKLKLINPLQLQRNRHPSLSQETASTATTAKSDDPPNTEALGHAEIAESSSLSEEHDTNRQDHVDEKKTNRNASRERVEQSSRRSPLFYRPETVGSEIHSETASLVGAGRRGVYIKLHGTHVSVIGEKGTRVPNITVKEITLEVECCLSVVFVYSTQDGWVSKDGLKFEVMQLRKKAIGNSIPLPAGLVKTLLNLILPKIVEKALANALPRELGQYLLNSKKGFAAAGEVTIAGPPLSATQAQLNTPSPYTQPRAQPTAVKAYSAVQEAQRLLSLSNDQAMLLGECFSKEKSGLLHNIDGNTGVCSIHELCRYYNRYRHSEIWLALCDLWNKAIRHISKERGLSCTLDFAGLMNGVVSRLAAKPVRFECRLTRLNCQINVDAFLVAMRDYCESTARELDAEKPLSVTIPLEEQLKVLHEWYSVMKERLVAFKSQFKSFMASIVARADARSLQIGLEKASYEGPMQFELPIVREEHDPGMLSFNVSIPAPGDSTSTQFMDSLSRALCTIHAFKTTDSSPTAQDECSEERCLEWGVSSAIGARLDKILDGCDNEEMPCLFTESLSLGKVFVHHLHTSITLNEDRIAQILLNSRHIIATASMKPNHVFAAGGALSSADSIQTALKSMGDVVAGVSSPDETSEDSSKYRLSFRSGDYARFKCLIDTLGFQSAVSPAEVFSMVYICLREYFRTFQTDDVIRFRTFDRLLKQVIKYVDKRSLNIVFCSHLESHVEDNAWMVSLREPHVTGSSIRYPIQVVNDLDISLLMDSLTLVQGKLEA